MTGDVGQLYIMVVEREFLIKNRKRRARMLKKVWFIGIVCLCLALSVGILNSKAISKQTETKTEYVYHFIEEFGEHKPELKYKNIYDNKGNKIEEVQYGRKLNTVTTYSYNKMGDRIDEEKKINGISLKTTYKYKYNETGDKIKVTEYDNGGDRVRTTTYKYDERGNEVEKQVYHGASYGHNRSDYKDIYEYDYQGNQTRWIFYEYDEEGNETVRWDFEIVKTRRTYEYDEEGNKIEEIWYDAEDELGGKYTYKYDEEGNEVEETKYEYKSISGEIKEIPIVKKIYEYYTKEDLNEEYTFRKTTWGMTREQVKSAEVGRVLYDTENTLVYEGAIAELDCNILYVFTGGKLVRAKYWITEEHSNRNDYIVDYDILLKKALTKKYGQPISDEQIWKNDLYKDNYQDWGFAVSIGHLSYWTRWQTLQTEIFLDLRGDNYNIILETQYTSKELRELEEKEKEKRLLENF